MLRQERCKMRAGLGITSRPPAVAGQFYPGDPDRLRTQVLELLANVAASQNVTPKALLAERNQLERLLIATDTPTGSGIMPLGILYTMAHLASLTTMAPEQAICAASGNNARVYRLDSGFLKVGHAADIVLLDAPDGGTQDKALDAIRHGDIAAIGAVVTAGTPRFVGRSRNTPATTRKARVVKSAIMQDFAAAAH
jgi:enamidase